jgi:hypothetical protein
MIKITTVSLVTAAMLSAGATFAAEKGDKACCAKSASNEKAECTDFASMRLTADQQKKLETWQTECMKAGCTKESRTAFLKKAEGILSKDQYATLKAQCDKSMAEKKTQT